MSTYVLHPFFEHHKPEGGKIRLKVKISSYAKQRKRVCALVGLGQSMISVLDCWMLVAVNGGFANGGFVLKNNDQILHE